MLHSLRFQTLKFAFLSHQVDTSAKRQRHTAAIFSKDSAWCCYTCFYSPSRFILPAAQMSHPEASLNEGQEIKSPRTSQVRMEPSNLSHSPLQNPPPTSVIKRRRSSSSPESVRKRQSREPAPTSLPPKPPPPETNWHCSNCGRPCWGCFSPPEVPPDVASLDEEEDIDRLRMASAPPSSQGAHTTPSRVTQTTDSPSTRKRKRALEAGVSYVGPKDLGFKTNILTPLNVFISSSRPEGIELEHIFGKEPPTPESRVIIKKDDAELKKIMSDFTMCQTRQYDERTLFTVCTDSVVLREQFDDAPLIGEDQNMTVSVRRDWWKPRLEGPNIPKNGYIYDWDMEPDTTYGVSTRMFDVKLRRELNRKECQPWLAECEAMVCPYLTVEYKCTEKTGRSSDATYQNTAASILWLYQRKIMRQELGCSLNGLKHFSVTFVDSNFTIWEAGFSEDLYSVRAIVRGAVTNMDGLKNYIKWSNAIHSWGLGANATSFKSDVEALLERRRNQQALPTPPSTASTADARQQSGIV